MIIQFCQLNERKRIGFPFNIKNKVNLVIQFHSFSLSIVPILCHCFLKTYAPNFRIALIKTFRVGVVPSSWSSLLHITFLCIFLFFSLSINLLNRLLKEIFLLQSKTIARDRFQVAFFQLTCCSLNCKICHKCHVLPCKSDLFDARAQFSSLHSLLIAARQIFNALPIFAQREGNIFNRAMKFIPK